MTDLDRLIEAVAAGSIGWYDFPEVCEAIWGDGEDFPNHMETIRTAYQGNLDAAKRLHDALLPGWMWPAMAPQYINGENIIVIELYERDGSGESIAEGKDMARAWLLAILKALRAKGGAG